MKKVIIPLFLSATFLTATGAQVYAANENTSSAKDMKEMSTEQRSKMATLHEQMATCLRSTKTKKECHTQMKDSCKTMMGKDGCMMGMWHDHDKDMKRE